MSALWQAETEAQEVGNLSDAAMLGLLIPWSSGGALVTFLGTTLEDLFPGQDFSVGLAATVPGEAQLVTMLEVTDPLL